MRFSKTGLAGVLAIFAIFFGLVSCCGKPVDSKTARQVAEAWLAMNPTPMIRNPAGKTWKTKGIRPFKGYSGETLAYIVDLKPQGFIVVPANDDVEPILTFGTEGDFQGDLGPEKILADLLASDIPSRIKNKDKMPQAYKDKVAERWTKARKASATTDSQTAAVATVTPSVGPLITNLWGQGSDKAPFTYNYSIPNHYITGCVATAMGMIIHYYGYPSSASCTNTVRFGGYPQTVSFSDTFNYDLMPASISGTSPLANIQEVSKLLYDCGVSIGMFYDTAANGGSGAYTTDVPAALINTFHYGSASWKSGRDSDWDWILRNELSSGFPVEVEIWSYTYYYPAGHAIVCDGWGTEDGGYRYHLNMGWDGYANNWYSVPGFSAGGYYWDQMAGYVYNIRKPVQMPVSVPTFSPAGGVYTAPQNVAITCSIPDAVIHYTTNGSEPTENDPIATGPVLVDKVEMLMAKAWKTGRPPSGIGNANYSFKAGIPSFSPDGDTSNSAVSVTVSCPTPGAVVRYTTNGVDPTTTSPIVKGPILVSQSVTLKAKAWKPGWPASPLKSSDYSISLMSNTKKQANGVAVTIPKVVVTAVPSPGRFYVEADDRSCGIMVYQSGYTATPGTRVTVQGTMGTSSSGEKWITATSITDAGTGTIEPLMLSNRSIGGGDWFYDASTGAGQKGVKDGTKNGKAVCAPGLNNIGMLITTTGKVTYSTTGYFYIDDGSKMVDDSGRTGVKVIGSVPQPSPLPAGWTPVGKCVKVTGISTCYKAASPSTDLYRQIWPTQVEVIQ